MATTGAPMEAGTGSRPRLDIHSNRHRFLAALLLVYPVGVWSVIAAWPGAVPVMALGLVAAWRVGFVRLAEIDGDRLLIRNLYTTRRLPAAAIDRFGVGRGTYPFNGQPPTVVVRLRPPYRRFARRHIPCTATMAFGSKRAAAISTAVASWAEAHDIRCDVDAHGMVGGTRAVLAPHPAVVWDAHLETADRRLRRELRHAGAHGHRPEAETAAETTRSDVDPAAAVSAAFQRVEDDVRRVAARGGLNEPDLHRLLLRALSAGLVHRSATASIEEVIALHRLVSRGELVPTWSQARRFAELVDDQLTALRLPPRG